MEYTVETMMDFTDIHSNEKYTKGKQLIVSEERALELFSSDHHLVKFIKREKVETDSGIDNVQKEGNSKPQGDDIQSENSSESDNGQNPISNKSEDGTQLVLDELDTMNFQQLQTLAKDRGLDISLANSKDKLRSLIRSSGK